MALFGLTVHHKFARDYAFFGDKYFIYGLFKFFLLEVNSFVKASVDPGALPLLYPSKLPLAVYPTQETQEPIIYLFGM